MSADDRFAWSDTLGTVEPENPKEVVVSHSKKIQPDVAGAQPAKTLESAPAENRDTESQQPILTENRNLVKRMADRRRLTVVIDLACVKSACLIGAGLDELLQTLVGGRSVVGVACLVLTDLDLETIRLAAMAHTHGFSIAASMPEPAAKAHRARIELVAGETVKLLLRDDVEAVAVLGDLPELPNVHAFARALGKEVMLIRLRRPSLEEVAA